MSKWSCTFRPGDFLSRQLSCPMSVWVATNDKLKDKDEKMNVLVSERAPAIPTVLSARL